MNDIIETKTIVHDGFTIRIDVIPDTDATPFDAECYSDANVQAWRDDEWLYVGYVYTATLDGIELGTSSIWASEWEFPGTESSIDAWITENYYHPDLLTECVTEARATLAALIEHAPAA